MCRMVAGSRGVGCAVYRGTGLKPPGCHGWHRPMRFTVNQPPRNRPNRLIALERIVGNRTDGIACGTEKRAHGPLVNSNQERGYVAHCAFYYSILTRTRRAFSRTSALQWGQTYLSRSSTARPGSRVVLRHKSRARSRMLTTRSTAGNSCWCRRNDSRIILRIRLFWYTTPGNSNGNGQAEAWLPFIILDSGHAKESIAQAATSRGKRHRSSDLCGVAFCAGSVSLLRAALSPVKRPPSMDDLWNELSTALGATAGQNGTAILGSHAGPKSCVRHAALCSVDRCASLHGLRRWSVGSQKGREG